MLVGLSVTCFISEYYYMALNSHCCLNWYALTEIIVLKKFGIVMWLHRWPNGPGFPSSVDNVADLWSVTLAAKLSLSTKCQEDVA